MRNFLDQTAGLWFKGGLVGKVGSARRHGGNALEGARFQGRDVAETAAKLPG